jgi:hypothetical protein
MALESLLTLFDSDVADVADVQANNGAGLRCNVTKIRDVADVADSQAPMTPAILAAVPATAFATSATAEKIVTLQTKPAPLLGCTAATSATAEIINPECETPNPGEQAPCQHQANENPQWRHLQTNVARRSTLQLNTGAGSSCNGSATPATSGATAANDSALEHCDLVEVHRLFAVIDPDGQRFSLSRNPPCTLAEIREDYPGCEIAPELGAPPAPPLDGDDLAVAYALLRAWDEDDTATGLEWLEGLARDPERLAGMRAMADELGLVPRKESAITADTRRTCRQCRNLARNGRCMAAGRGELPLTSSRYEPFTDRLERCIGYLPGPDDPDQRPGKERYPNLTARAGR